MAAGLPGRQWKHHEKFPDVEPGQINLSVLRNLAGIFALMELVDSGTHKQQFFF